MRPQVRTTVALCLGLFAVGFQASATSSIGYDGEPFSVHLVGGAFSFDDGLMVEVSEPDGPRTLPARTYRKESYDYRTSLRLRFDNPGNPSLPPSFTLVVCGNQATMTVEGRSHHGCFAWLDDGSDCPAAGAAPRGRGGDAPPDCAAGK